MFTAIKNKLSSPQSQAVQAAPGSSVNDHHHGVSSMNAALQKKFARGVHYNLKLLLRGDRNTGKSCLFQRLQGGSFVENYVASEEINVASIQWNYKATDDIVKVEVWDVVDRGKKRKQIEGLKLTDAGQLEPALDAEFVDVYKGAHGVIIMFDVTKAWTFDYVKREAPKVPKHIPILILANFIDKAHHRCVTRAQAIGFIEDELNRGDQAAEARYAESSMRNGFGLKFLHKFLNLPFLTLQRQSILKQLETNEREMEATLQELDYFLESNEADYESYSSGVTKKRRAQAEKLAPAPTIDVVVGQPSNTFKETKIVTNEAKTVAAKNPDPLPAEPFKVEKSPSKMDAVDNFVPDNDAIDNFLAETPKKMSSLNLSNENQESDEDEDSIAQPKVAGFTEDIDIDDYKGAATNSIQDASSSEDEKPAAAVMKINKPKVLPKLSNSSGEGFFDLPDHLKSVNEPAEDEPDNVTESSRKHHKKGKKSKKHKKQKSMDKERDDLEEFLNGIPSSNKDEAAYEEL